MENVDLPSASLNFTSFKVTSLAQVASIFSSFLIVLKKSKTDSSVLFVDASAQFKRVGNKNKLMGEDQEKILGALDAREFQEYFAALVSNEEIGKNDYNLAVSSYVEPEDTREVIEIG